jgi:tetratricopeptide (TPR) repeat protein
MSGINQDQTSVPVAERLGKVEGELAVLKAASEKKTPWFKEPSTIVATLAFIFSLGTTVVSYIRTEQQDVHDARTELQGYIEKLSSLPKDSYTLLKDFQNDPQAAADLSGTLNGERVYYARRAAEVIQHIPNKVSSTEANFVALALFQSGRYTEGTHLATLAIANAKDYIEELAADRNLGGFLIYQGKLKEGRDKLQSALEIFSNSKYFENNDDTKNNCSFETEVYWAGAEANAGQFSEAKTHIDNAHKILAKMPSGPEKDWNAQRLATFQASPGPSSTPGILGLPQPPGVKRP